MLSRLARLFVHLFATQVFCGGLIQVAQGRQQLIDTRRIVETTEQVTVRQCQVMFDSRRSAGQELSFGSDLLREIRRLRFPRLARMRGSRVAAVCGEILALGNQFVDLAGQRDDPDKVLLNRIVAVRRPLRLC